MSAEPTVAERPAGELRYRASTQLAVSYPQRTIELVVIPYDEVALVQHPTEPRMVFESIARGAFDGIERRANRIRANRDHDLKRTVGRAISFQTSHTDGLVGTIRIAKTELGDETLALAEDECLDASAGFLPMPGGEHWLERDQVRHEKCWLGHIALLPEPAYESARVLSVRAATPPSAAAEPATPNLDKVREWLLEDEYRRLEVYTRES